MTRKTFIISLTALIIGVVAIVAAAQNQQGPGRPGWGPGLRCPCGGPNVNPASIVTIDGIVQRVDMELGERFPSFTLTKADGTRVTIMAGPYRLLFEKDFEINVGDRMSVRAFPSLRFEGVYVAIELKNLTTGEAVTLRDDDGTPRWGPGRGRGPGF